MLGCRLGGRIVVAVAVEPWPFHALAAFGRDLEDLEPEPSEDDAL